MYDVCILVYLYIMYCGDFIYYLGNFVFVNGKFRWKNYIYIMILKRVKFMED